jgi:hypothetical protein
MRVDLPYTANIRLGQKLLTLANAQAYYCRRKVTTYGEEAQWLRKLSIGQESSSPGLGKGKKIRLPKVLLNSELFDKRHSVFSDIKLFCGVIYNLWLNAFNREVFTEVAG